ncbi:MAG: DegV family protein [Clostridia bacterium]|nr:DegV family protein [Clostridia bacterium]
MKTRIIIDSTADLAAELRPRFTIIPLTLRFGEEEFIDGVTISRREFYEKLVESDVLPTTSQVTPYTFTNAFRQAVDAGEDVVCITISGKLSGTCQSAMIAAEDFPGRVYVVDSHSVALGSGILAEYALQLADSGMEAREIAERLIAERDNVCLIAMLDTLEYLKRGGRISKTTAIAGELLSIKPVISIPNGEITILGKARGSRNGNNLLVKEIQKAGGVNFARPVLLGYTGLSDALLQKYIHDSAPLWQEHMDELHSTIVGSVVGTHAGPGAIAVAFFRN